MNVHEPPGISSGYTEPIQVGQIFSNEPGFYVEGQFGVRIESAVLVKHVKTDVEFGSPDWMGFERLTQVPIQKSLVDWELLSSREKQWLKSHNNSCKQAILPLIQNDRRAVKWLKRQ